MTENRSLKAFAIIIFIFAILITVLSGLCSFFFTTTDPKQVLAFFAIGAIGFVPAGLLAYAMWRHIKKGPNLASEIITASFGVLTVFIMWGLFGVGIAGAGLGGVTLISLISLIPCALLLGWAVWSFIARLRGRKQDSYDTFG